MLALLYHGIALQKERRCRPSRASGEDHLNPADKPLIIITMMMARSISIAANLKGSKRDYEDESSISTTQLAHGGEPSYEEQELAVISGRCLTSTSWVAELSIRKIWNTRPRTQHSTLLVIDIGPPMNLPFFLHGPDVNFIREPSPRLHMQGPVRVCDALGADLLIWALVLQPFPSTWDVNRSVDNRMGDMDTLRREFSRHAKRKRPLGVFTGREGGHARITLHRGRSTGVDKRRRILACTLVLPRDFEHKRNHRLCEEESAFAVHASAHHALSYASVHSAAHELASSRRDLAHGERRTPRTRKHPTTGPALPQLIPEHFCAQTARWR